MESVEVSVAAIHDIEGACFQRENIQHVDFMDFSIGDLDKARDVTPQIQQGMKSDGSLCFPKACPGKDR